MILKYQKIFKKFDARHSTTITLVEPDYGDDDPRMTELCTIGDDTYVHWPDNLEMPEQPFNIDVSMESVTLTNELKKEIKELSPHVQLSYKRLDDRIREKYTINDELYLSRILHGTALGTYTMKDDEPGKIAEYQAWVEESREIARLERAALGLG